MSDLNEAELGKLMTSAVEQLRGGERTAVSFSADGWTHDDVVTHSQAYAPIGKRLVWTLITGVIPEDAVAGVEVWELSLEQMDTIDARVCTLDEAMAQAKSRSLNT